MSKREKYLAVVVMFTIFGLSYLKLSLLFENEYERDFDKNLSEYPFAASIAKRDRGLRQIFLDQTEAAFNKGGWRAANAALDISLAVNVATYADDEHIYAIARETLALFAKLKNNPSACKAFALAGSRKDEFLDARKEVDEYFTAFRAAEENGFNRKLFGVKWVQPSDEELIANEQSLVLGPDPMSAAELEAKEKYTSGEAESFCNAVIKETRNVLAKETSEAARAERLIIAGVGKVDWVEVVSRLCRRNNPMPNGLNCSKSTSLNVRG